jgi:hypothetical protein
MASMGRDEVRFFGVGARTPRAGHKRAGGGRCRQPPAMSGLSNRVMNMKFMQKGGEQRPEPAAKVRDPSEWALAAARAPPRPAVETVGYTSINAATPRGRRTWGAPATSDDADDDAEADPDATDAQEAQRAEPKQFLRNLWDKPAAKAKLAKVATPPPAEQADGKRKGSYIPNIKNKQKRLGP